MIAGIYNGSFDPPHNGHLEAVQHALRFGMRSITITYRDPNPYKPFRTGDSDRREMLQRMFAGMQQVVISEESYRSITLGKRLDPAVQKIYLIAGSDIFERVEKARDESEVNKVSYFIVPRAGAQVPPSRTTWDAIPFTVFEPDVLVEQHHSSTAIRTRLQEGKKEPLPLPQAVGDYITEKKLYQLTKAESSVRELFLKAKEALVDELYAFSPQFRSRYPLSIRLGQDIGKAGLSGDLVTFVYDKDAQPLMVVKIFSNGAGNAKSERVAMASINSLHLPTAGAPVLQFYSERKGFSLLAMSHAQGVPLSQVMLQSPAAIKLCAKACRELHLSARRAATDVTDAQLKIFEEAIGKVVGRLQEHPGFAIDCSTLQERWKHIREQFKKNPGHFSFTHGDPNPNNFIVDLEHNRVSFVDLSLFSRSLSPENLAFGFAYNELAEALSSIWIVGKEMHLSIEDIGKIQACYREEYLKEAPADIATKEAMLYFDSYWALREINTLLKNYTAETHALIEQKLHTFLG